MVVAEVLLLAGPACAACAALPPGADRLTPCLPACPRLPLPRLQSILEQDALHAGFRSEVLKSQELQVGWPQGAGLGVGSGWRSRPAGWLAGWLAGGCPQAGLARQAAGQVARRVSRAAWALLSVNCLGRASLMCGSVLPRWAPACPYPLNGPVSALRPAGGHLHAGHRAAADQPGEDPVRDTVRRQRGWWWWCVCALLLGVTQSCRPAHAARLGCAVSKIRSPVCPPSRSFPPSCFPCFQLLSSRAFFLPPRSYEIDKLTASQRLDLNLEKGRMRDELQMLRDKSNELEIKARSFLNREGGRECLAGRVALAALPVPCLSLTGRAGRECVCVVWAGWWWRRCLVVGWARHVRPAAACASPPPLLFAPRARPLHPALALHLPNTRTLHTAPPADGQGGQLAQGRHGAEQERHGEVRAGADAGAHDGRAGCRAPAHALSAGPGDWQEGWLAGRAGPDCALPSPRPACVFPRLSSSRRWGLLL